MRYLFIFLAAFCTVDCAAKSTFVKPSDSVITFVGRNLKVEDAVQFAYPGFQIKFDFKGTDLKVGLSTSPYMSNTVAYYYILIDEEISESLEVRAATQFHKIQLPSDDQFHTITIFRKSEAFCGTGLFHGIKYGNGTLKKSVLKSRSILWIGDSFTCGYGNKVSIEVKDNPSTGFHAENEDNYWAFGAIASRQLNTEYSCVAYSGKGVYRNFDGEQNDVIPDLFQYTLPHESVRYDSSEMQQDLIVIKLGTNDFGRELNGKKSTDSALFVSRYLAFLDTIVAYHPNAEVALVFGGGITDYYPSNLKRLTRYAGMMDTIHEDGNKKYPGKFYLKQLETVLPPYGEDWHPTIKEQVRMANQLVPFIKTVMNW